MIALTVKRLRDTDAVKLDNLCKNGISIPLKAASVLDFGYKIPSTDTTYKINLDC
jgi:hypothetical protein